MNCDAELYARLTEAEKRLAALESTLAAAERLAQTPASSMPDAIEQTEVEPPGCPKCDGVAGTKCRCLDSPAPEPKRCQSLSPRGGVSCSLPAGHPAPHQGLPHQMGTWRDPEPQWRRLVDQQHQDLADLRADGRYEALSDVLECLSVHASAQSQPHDRALALARVVAVCEQQVGDGWQADPDDWPNSWDDPVDVWSLLDALCDTEDKWQSLGDRAATWLRDLTDGAA